MTRWEWEKKLESSYTIMPKWYYNKTKCDKEYEEYLAFNRKVIKRDNDE